MRLRREMLGICRSLGKRRRGAGAGIPPAGSGRCPGTRKTRCPLCPVLALNPRDAAGKGWKMEKERGCGVVCRERPRSRCPEATWETGMWLTRACAGDRDPTKPFRAFQSSLSFARTFTAVVGINGAIVGIIIPNNPTHGSLWSRIWNCSPQHCPSALVPCFPAGMPGRIPPSLVSHPPSIPHHQGKGLWGAEGIQRMS